MVCGHADLEGLVPDLYRETVRAAEPFDVATRGVDLCPVDVAVFDARELNVARGEAIEQLHRMVPHVSTR